MVNRGDSYGKLPDYRSFDLAWLAPITYPLVLSLVTISFALWEAFRAGRLSTATNAVATASVYAEAFFAVLCLVQCAANFHQRAYAGGASACDFQAWYACFWLFSSMGLQAYVAHVSREISRSRKQPNRNRVASIVVGILLAALLLSLLPAMGAGYYAFPKDFCMFELEDPAMGGLFLASFFSALICAGVCHIGSARILSSPLPSGADAPELTNGEVKDESTRDALSTMPRLGGALSPARLQVLMLLWFAAVWTPTAIVVLLHQTGRREPPVNSSESFLIAITLHSQQLFYPLLVGIVWRRWAAEIASNDYISAKRRDTVETSEQGEIL